MSQDMRYAGFVADQLDEDQDKRLASRRVADHLRAAIHSGRYPVGSAIPPYRQLAVEHGVAVNTAIAAVRLLRDEGLVTIRPNAGATVRDRAEVLEAAVEIRSLRAELGELGGEVRAASASLAAIEARLSDAAARLGALDGE